MAEWYLIVATKEGEHRLKIGQDEAQALQALDEAKNRIVSVRIEEDTSGRPLA